MRTVFSLIVPVAAAVAAYTVAPPAAAAGAKAQAAAGSTAPVPAEVRARVVEKLQGAKAEDVASSPIAGLYEVTLGGLIVYVSEDGKYLVSGNVYDLETQSNLTAARRNEARARTLAAASTSDMIIFSPPDPKMTVTVFTDVDCGFCRKFHNQMAEINKAGVRVRYMMYPRTGPGTESWRKAESVWCAKDRKEAMTRAKRGEEVKSPKCDAASIKAQYELGEDLGLEGTPAIFTESGDYIGGFLTPAQLVKAISGPGKVAGASR
jgi:thiol:disulfide interchange protein DsbC